MSEDVETLHDIRDCEHYLRDLGISKKMAQKLVRFFHRMTRRIRMIFGMVETTEDDAQQESSEQVTVTVEKKITKNSNPIKLKFSTTTKALKDIFKTKSSEVERPTLRSALSVVKNLIRCEKKATRT